tara:strand:- start:1811 stop:2524 length:714 start_codon:yes stop_codon:yes gene_type:complete
MGLFKQKGYDAGDDTGSSRKVVRQANKQMKQAKLDTFEGNTNLEKKANMAAAKNRAKTVERKASKVVKKTERKEDRAARVTARGAEKANKLNARAAKNKAKSESTDDSIIKGRTANRSDRLANKAVKVSARSEAKAEKISPTKVTKPVVKKEVAKKEVVKAKKPVAKKEVKTKRGTGKTYKSAWDGMSAEKKAGFKGGYGEFQKKAVAYNSRKDSKGVMKSDKNKTTKGPKKKDGSY